MSEFLNDTVPMFALMLIPVWIPLLVVGVGAAYDGLTARSARRAAAVRTPARVRANGYHRAVLDPAE